MLPTVRGGEIICKKSRRVQLSSCNSSLVCKRNRKLSILIVQTKFCVRGSGRTALEWFREFGVYSLRGFEGSDQELYSRLLPVLYKPHQHAQRLQSPLIKEYTLNHIRDPIII